MKKILSDISRMSYPSNESLQSQHLLDYMGSPYGRHPRSSPSGRTSASSLDNVVSEIKQVRAELNLMKLIYDQATRILQLREKVVHLESIVHGFLVKGPDEDDVMCHSQAAAAVSRDQRNFNLVPNATRSSSRGPLADLMSFTSEESLRESVDDSLFVVRGYYHKVRGRCWILHLFTLSTYRCFSHIEGAISCALHAG